MPKIISRRKSLETCSEAGWYAFDYLLDGPLDDEYIRKFRNIPGSFLYMPMLKQPFFKLESDNYLMKGIRGTDFFRAAVSGDKIDSLPELLGKLEEEKKTE